MTSNCYYLSTSLFLFSMYLFVKSRGRRFRVVWQRVSSSVKLSSFTRISRGKRDENFRGHSRVCHIVKSLNINSHQVTKRLPHGGRHFQKIYGGFWRFMDPLFFWNFIGPDVNFVNDLPTWGIEGIFLSLSENWC